MSATVFHPSYLPPFSSEGVVSTYVHEYLKEGAELKVTGPYGDFFLRGSDRDILLIASGSGLAPIKSIWHRIEQEKFSRKVTLLFTPRRILTYTIPTCSNIWTGRSIRKPPEGSFTWIQGGCS